MAHAVHERYRFQRPALKKILTRPRLHDRLRAVEDCRVLLLYARAGQGKSTLLADYLQTDALDGRWYNLSEQDRDPAVFLAGLKRCLFPGGDCGSVPADLGRARQTLEQVLNAAAPDLALGGAPGGSAPGRSAPGSFAAPLPRSYLVLDSYQCINSSPEACLLVNELIELLPENLGLAVLSREYPRFSLPRIIAVKQLAVIEDGELAFTPEETAGLFKAIYGIDLPGPAAVEIQEISEGWATALIHLGESLEAKQERHSNQILQQFIASKQLPSLQAYCKEELIDGLDEETKELLITFSAFHSITPGLVSYLTGRSGTEVLEELESKNLFLRPLDPAGKVHVLHPVFRQYLATRFSSRSQNERRRIHRSAADYFHRAGRHQDAAHHHQLSRGFVEAQRLILKEADTLLEQGQYKQLHDLLESFPEEVRQREPLRQYYHTITTNLVHPLLSRKTLTDLLAVFRKAGDIDREAKIYSVLLVNYLFYQGNREAVAELLTATESFLRSRGESLNPNARLTLDTLISFARWWTKPDIDEAFDIALRAEETAHQIHNEEVLIFSHLILARIYIDRGEFFRATEVLEETEKLVARNPALRQYEPLLRFYLGDTCFYIGELTQALDQIEQGLARTFSEFAFRQYLKLNQALYLLYIPELEKAEAVLESVHEQSMGQNLYLRYYSIYLLHMLLAYRKGNRERAAFYCGRLMDPENEQLLSTDYPYSYLALAEVQLFLDQQDVARLTLSTVLERAPADKYPYPCATAHALLGVILDEQGKKRDSRAHFQVMKQIMAEKGYRNLDICNPALLHNVVMAASVPELKSFPRLKHMSASQLINQSVAGLNLFTLGSFRIVLNGKEISGDILSRHKKVMDLLKLLVVHRGEGLLKEVLYNLFWPGYMEKSSRNNLNTIIYRLRKILGEDTHYILTDPETIRLNLDHCTIDADDFREMLRVGKGEEEKGNLAAALNTYSAAREIYRGDFLEKDLYYDDIRDERETLKSACLQLLLKLVKMHLEAGRYHRALELNKELIAEDRLCEPAYRLLMICSSLVGNRSEVPRIYERLQERLLRSFGIEPDPQTAVLKNQLLGGVAPTASLWQKETLI